jgi:hypothetical protein
VAAYHRAEELCGFCQELLFANKASHLSIENHCKDTTARVPEERYGSLEGGGGGRGGGCGVLKRRDCNQSTTSRRALHLKAGVVDLSKPV